MMPNGIGITLNNHGTTWWEIVGDHIVFNFSSTLSAEQTALKRYYGLTILKREVLVRLDSEKHENRL